jgi:hypothetical protein
MIGQNGFGAGEFVVRCHRRLDGSVALLTIRSEELEHLCPSALTVSLHWLPQFGVVGIEGTPIIQV